MRKLNALSDPELVSSIRKGDVAVVPTDTVYGLVCSAADETAVARLYDLKKREQKPGTVVAADIEQLVELGIKRRYLKAVEQYWPNPISIVIPCGPELAYIHRGLHSIAVRIPADEAFQALLNRTGPLLTTSANMPGHPEAMNVEEAENYFGRSIDVYVDGGDLSGHKASTVIRILDDAVEVLRPGAVTIDESGAIKS